MQTRVDSGNHTFTLFKKKIRRTPTPSTSMQGLLERELDMFESLLLKDKVAIPTLKWLIMPIENRLNCAISLLQGLKALHDKNIMFNPRRARDIKLINRNTRKISFDIEKGQSGKFEPTLDIQKMGGLLSCLLLGMHDEGLGRRELLERSLPKAVKASITALVENMQLMQSTLTANDCLQRLVAIKEEYRQVSCLSEEKAVAPRRSF